MSPDFSLSTTDGSAPEDRPKGPDADFGEGYLVSNRRH